MNKNTSRHQALMQEINTWAVLFVKYIVNMDKGGSLSLRKLMTLHKIIQSIDNAEILCVKKRMKKRDTPGLRTT